MHRTRLTDRDKKKANEAIGAKVLPQSFELQTFSSTDPVLLEPW
jgi:hypothetical protein